MFIPYLGEKSKYANFIIPHIPQNINKYVEPFGGMFGIFFSLELTQFRNVEFVYNDSNYLNYNLFNQLVKSEFLSELEKVKASEDKFNKYKLKILNNNYSDFELAIAWLMILCCSASQYDLLSNDYKGDSEFEVFKMKLKLGKNRLSKITEIHNQDFTQIIQSKDSKDTFFYVDPPYYNREHYYVNHNFNQNSHYQLATLLNSIKGRFALSYFDFPELKDWYQGCKIIKQRTLMGTELLIMNY